MGDFLSGFHFVEGLSIKRGTQLIVYVLTLMHDLHQLCYCRLLDVFSQETHAELKIKQMKISRFVVVPYSPIPAASGTRKKGSGVTVRVMLGCVMKFPKAGNAVQIFTAGKER